MEQKFTSLKELLPADPFVELREGEETDFMQVTDLIGKAFAVVARKEFEKDGKGTGVHILLFLVEEQRFVRTCTYAIGVVTTLARDVVVDALADGKWIYATFQQRPSKNNPTRKVVRLVPI